jgi:carboxylesterase type B
MLEDYNPFMFVALTDVIVVIFNYRVDIFGFLHLKDNENEQIDGNQGILDQFLALKWINQNIESFGGDNTKVTLMGHAAGSLSVGYHLTFSLSWPFFRNAILLSGSPVSATRTILSSSQASNRTKFFLKDIGCPQKKLIECARNIESKNLTLFSKIFHDKKIVGANTFSRSHLRSAFLPTFDNIFFSDTPIRAFRTENFKSWIYFE